VGKEGLVKTVEKRYHLYMVYGDSKYIAVKELSGLSTFPAAYYYYYYIRKFLTIGVC
jgi:hypothetical protein